jgi:hypothetical protein
MTRDRTRSRGLAQTELEDKLIPHGKIICHIAYMIKVKYVMGAANRRSHVGYE